MSRPLIHTQQGHAKLCAWRDRVADLEVVRAFKDGSDLRYGAGVLVFGSQPSAAAHLPRSVGRLARIAGRRGVAYAVRPHCSRPLLTELRVRVTDRRATS
jgi:hypothetical protein